MAIRHTVRFDWAIKKLLRNKANYDVLEGFLSVLLERQVRIHRFLSEESNQNDKDDKFNRVDVLAEDSDGELIIIEIQNSREHDYFHRMLYGTSKTVTEYIDLGEEYSNVKKVYSINIVYFNLGQGTDYVYKGETSFKGIHDSSILGLSKEQKEMFDRQRVEEIFPEYYLLRVEKFNDYAKDSLDEWISFLKSGEIDESYTGQGLPQAREKLQFEKMSEEDRKAYRKYMEDIRYANSLMKTSHYDGYVEGEAKGRADEQSKAHEEKLQSAYGFYTAGAMTVGQIAAIMKLNADELSEYIASKRKE